MSFSTRVFGKWILAGEHSVLRGFSALVFPLRSNYLDLQWNAGAQSGIQSLDVKFLGPRGEELQLLFWAVFEKALQILKVPRDNFIGQLSLWSNIPVGAGLGASATLCVAVTRWLGFLGWVSEQDYYEFAKNLEDLFHGESSGVDIAVALSGQGLLFDRSGLRQSVVCNWQPTWAISYTGQRGITAECVQKVKNLFAQNPQLGRQWDEQMQKSVLLAQKALQQGPEGLDTLIEALNLSHECFEHWGLTEGVVGQHLQELREAGALAVKPTGSGGGGFVLSLWARWPDSNLVHKFPSLEKLQQL